MNKRELTKKLFASGLTRRQAEVVHEVSKDLTNKEIAQNLYITEKAVKFHLTNIFKMVPPKNRQDLKGWISTLRA